MNKVSRYVKRPVVIEAMQFSATSTGAQKIIDWINECVGFDPSKGGDSPVMYYYGELTIRTLEGNMTASDGDWIIRGIKGEFYPCKHDIFVATYEPVNE